MITKSSIHCDKCNYKEKLEVCIDGIYNNWTIRYRNGKVEHHCWQCGIKPEKGENEKV